jgi:RNA polymerase sigma-54 factor
VGARDLKECLFIQLRAGRLKNGIVERIIEGFLVELETRNFQAIAKAMKITLEQVIENVQIIAELEPIPGRQFGGLEAQYVVPDVYVFKVAGEWIVTLNDEGLPHLKVSKMYEKMAGKMGGTNKDYLQEKLKSAQWLIKSIQQRQKTILRVTEKLVERQKDFFEKGVEYLKPMVLRDIADDIGMHESTISRVTSNKYVHTPQGIFELKYFFNSSVSMSSGDSLASASVKKIISDIIGKEDVRHPLADQRIVEILDERGIQLARRTVAKYREQLGILPSSKRKKYY